VSSIQPFVSPLQGLEATVSPDPGRCPGLICLGPFDAKEDAGDFLRTNRAACSYDLWAD
jgi:hypothetical protein